MRGLAALFVLAGHIRRLFFVDRSRAFSLFSRACYFVTGLSHQAVVVFFVLSGFLVGNAVVSPWRDRTWSWERYALRRLTRLYVVLLPTLLLTFLWDTAGFALFGPGSIYSGKIHARFLDLADVRVTLALPVLLGNLAFLQDLVTPAFGSNGPLWTLAFEFWSYVTFPLLFRAAFGSESGAARLSYGIAGVSVLSIGGDLMRLSFATWAVGAGVAMIWALRPGLPPPGRAVVFGAVLTFILGIYFSQMKLAHSRTVEDLLLAVATGAFIAVLVARGEAAGARTRGPGGSRYARFGAVLAGFSFTLYAVQLPVVTFFQAWLVGNDRLRPDLPHAMAAIAFGLLVVGAYVYPLARLTEAHTEDVRRMVERVLARVRAGAHAAR